MKLFIRFVAVCFLISLSIVSIAVGVVDRTYAQKFYPGVAIDGLRLGGLTKAEGKVLLQKRIDAYLSHPVSLLIPDISQEKLVSTGTYPNITIASTASALGLQFNTDQVLEQAWKVGRESQAGKAVYAQAQSTFLGKGFSLPFTISNEEGERFIAVNVLPRISVPVAAKIEIKDGLVSVIPSKKGLEINKADLSHQLAKALESVTDGDATYIKAPTSEVDSPITQAIVEPVASKLNSLANTKITLATTTGITLKPSRSDLLQWFIPTQDETGAIALSLVQDPVAKFLEKNKALDQKPSLTKAVSGLNTLLNQEALPANYSVALVAAPVKEVVPGTYTPGKFEGKYIEVSLAEQKMYLINGNTLEKTYIVSSGKWSTPTPVGTYTIHGKAKRAYSATYGLYMPYWMNFLNNEYGIHELPEWPNGYKEGEAHLGTPVSHGCIRLGVGSAAEVYNWTEDQTPLYIH